MVAFSVCWVEPLQTLGRIITLMQPSCLSRNALYISGPFSSGTRCVTTKDGSMSPFSTLRHQLRQVVLHLRLRHPERQASIDRAAHRNLVDEPAIYADDRDHAEVARVMDCLPQHMRADGAEEGGNFCAIQHRVEARGRVRLSADPRRCRHPRRGPASAPGSARTRLPS